MTTGQQALPYRGGMEATTKVRHLRSGPGERGKSTAVRLIGGGKEGVA
jgi:hypothetical protein